MPIARRSVGLCFRAAAFLLSVSALATAACRGDGGGGGSFAAMLKDLPAAAGDADSILFADFTRAGGPAEGGQKIDGEARKSLGDRIADHASLNFAMPQLLGYARQYAIVGCETLAEVNLDCSRVTRAVSVPHDDGRPGRFDVVYGDFKASDVIGAFDCDKCPLARKASDNGRDYYTWTDDPEAISLDHRFAPPTFDAFGRAGVLALREGVAYRTLAVADMKALLAARDGKSLADDPAYLALAKALDEQGTANAFITSRGQTLKNIDYTAFGATNPEARAQLEAAAKGKTVLRPYQLMGIGQGNKGGQTFMVIVLFNETKDRAAENARLAKERIASETSLRSNRPWAEIFTSVETRSSGRVTEIVLSGPGVSSFNAFWQIGDPLLLYVE